MVSGRRYTPSRPLRRSMCVAGSFRGVYPMFSSVFNFMKKGHSILQVCDKIGLPRLMTQDVVAEIESPDVKNELKANTREALNSGVIKKFLSIASDLFVWCGLCLIPVCFSRLIFSQLILHQLVFLIDLTLSIHPDRTDELSSLSPRILSILHLFLNQSFVY